MPMARKWQEMKPLAVHPQKISTFNKKLASENPLELLEQLQELLAEQSSFFVVPLVRKRKSLRGFLAIPKINPSPIGGGCKIGEPPEMGLRLGTLQSDAHIVCPYRSKVRVRPLEKTGGFDGITRALLNAFGQEGKRIILSEYARNPTRAGNRKEWWELITPEWRDEIATMFGIPESYFNASP